MFNGCDDDYKKIKNKFCEEKDYKICYIQGPRGERGPKGDTGAATIEVGSTETVSSSDNASVVNVGTSSDVVLNFKIPRK